MNFERITRQEAAEGVPNPLAFAKQQRSAFLRYRASAACTSDLEALISALPEAERQGALATFEELFDHYTQLLNSLISALERQPTLTRSTTWDALGLHTYTNAVLPYPQRKGADWHFVEDVFATPFAYLEAHGVTLVDSPPVEAVRPPQQDAEESEAPTYEAAVARMYRDARRSASEVETPPPDATGFFKRPRAE